MKKKVRNWLIKHLAGHITIKWFGLHLTFYGFNAMQCAMNIYTRRWGWVCFRPPIHVLDWNWPWKFYVSPNATPGAATFAIGPGVSKEVKRRAKIRREVLGHNYPVDAFDYSDVLNIEEMADGWPGLA